MTPDLEAIKARADEEAAFWREPTEPSQSDLEGEFIATSAQLDEERIKVASEIASAIRSLTPPDGSADG